MAAPKNENVVLGEALAEAGADLAASNAGSEWQQQAAAAFKTFARRVGRPFQTREARAYAEQGLGIAPPPEPRAWGAIARLASREGIVRPVGVGKSIDPRQHAGFVTQWVAS